MTEIEPHKEKSVSEVDPQSTKVTRVPQYRRDVFPVNTVLSAEDLAEFCELTREANERAKNIEFGNFDLTKFESAQKARDRVNELMPIEYTYLAKNGDSIQGLGAPKTEDGAFPEELRSFFISNASFARRAINAEPLNVVDVFLSFAKPTLKIDLHTFPSNPTENKSVVNIYGRDEDWVISTTERIQNFLQRKRSFRPIIHKSGTYDYFIYLLFLPTLIWLIWKRGGPLNTWLEAQSVFLNVVLGIYAILISLLFARFAFQYSRWLFPPMEYYKKTRFGAYAHRAIAGTVCSAVLLRALYDIAKEVVVVVFGS